MTRILATLLTFALLLTPLVIDIPRAAACSCGLQSIEQHAADADVIAIGTIAGPGESGWSSASARMGTYVKGSGPETLTIDQAGFGTCALFYLDSVGRRYVFMMREREDGAFTTSFCDGSRDVTAYSDAQLAPLLERVRSGFAAQVTPAPSPTIAGPAPNADPPSQALDTIALVLIGAVTVIALAAGAVAVWRGTRA